jgi:hypothetical protein
LPRGGQQESDTFWLSTHSITLSCDSGTEQHVWLAPQVGLQTRLSVKPSNRLEAASAVLMLRREITRIIDKFFIGNSLDSFNIFNLPKNKLIYCLFPFFV